MPKGIIRKIRQGGKLQNGFNRKRIGIGSFLLNYGILIVAGLLFFFFSLMEPQFCTVTNILTIVQQASILGLLALGLTIIVIAGEFDISFVAIATFSGVIPVVLIMQGVNLGIAWTAGVSLGIICSFATAANVMYLGIPSFIASLGMMISLSGVSRALTGGITTYPNIFPWGFDLVGRYMIIGLIPSPVITFAIASVLLLLLLDYTAKGRYIYAVGGNPQAAFHVGIKVNRIKFLAFLIAGILYGTAGIIMSSTFGSCSPNMGEGYLLPAIIACFLGATFLTEGVPNPGGTVVSTMLLTILSNGFTMINVPFYGRYIIQGIILLISIGLLITMRKRRQTI